MNDIDKTATVRPFGEFQGHAFFSRFDFTVLGVERLIKSANVDAAVTGCDTNAVSYTHLTLPTKRIV